MKRKVYLFLYIIIFGLLIAPVVNFISQTTSNMPWWHIQRSYRIDFATRWVSFLLYNFGISIDPNQVVIGKQGWLYLGDKHEETKTVGRRGQTSKDLKDGKNIGATMKSWDHWLTRNGVQLFQVMVAPNKESIYPEYLPKWAAIVTPSRTDALFAGIGNERYIDLRDILIKAKQESKYLIYYKTDSHWNTYGSALAFQEFSRQITLRSPEIQWPKLDQCPLVPIILPVGGDLARILKIPKEVRDTDVTVQCDMLKQDTTLVDYNTQKIIRHGNNLPIPSPDTPLYVSSPNALNSKRVLWLRDSFGTIMAPFMAATFTDVIQIHWELAFQPGGQLVELVKKWQPDYVFVTTAERLLTRQKNIALPPR